MNYIKLDQIEKDIKSTKARHIAKDIFGELFRLGIFVVSISIVIIVFVNFNVFYYAFKQKVLMEKSFASDIVAQISGNESMNINELSNASQENATIASSDGFENLNNQKYMDVLESKLNLIKADENNNIYEKDITKSLKNKIRDYSFDFNLLPPDKRIIIPEIDVNAPIVDLSYASAEKLKNAEYDEDLYNGVVKYPYTPDPDHTGAVLIFGHTSYYWWKKNPYGEVFSRIPYLKTGSVINIIWGGNTYEYEVVDKIIRTPSQVAAEYEKYKDGKYLILMGCYPIGTSSKRMMIITKQKDQ